MGMKSSMGGKNPMAGIRGSYNPSVGHNGVINDTPDANKHMRGFGGGSFPGSRQGGIPNATATPPVIKSKRQ